MGGRAAGEMDGKVFDSWSRRVKIALEILAIPTVVVWGFTRFPKAEAPTDVDRIDIQDDVDWPSQSPDDCWGEYKVIFANVGKTRVNVETAEVTVWILDDLDAGTTAVSFDPKEQERHPAAVGPKPIVELVHSYGPNETTSAGMTVKFHKSPGKIALFKIRSGDWYRYNWRYVCDDNGSAVDGGSPGQPGVSRNVAGP
jgi:hypothetical protein